MINPGQLKHRYKVYKTVTGVDAQGFKTKKLTEIVSGKCAVTNEQVIDNDRSSSKIIDTLSTSITCIMRYHPEIDEHCIVELNGKKYRVKTFINIDFRNRYLKLVIQNV